MFWRPLLCLLAYALSALVAAAAPAAPEWNRATVAPSKTSIYVGSVHLIPGEMIRQGNTMTANYEVKVSPWFFWGETGHMTLTVSDAELAKLAAGQRAEFTGTGTNHKNKPRTFTGYADPSDASIGKIKVRILADGYTLIFNTTYHLSNGEPTATATP